MFILINFICSYVIIILFLVTSTISSRSPVKCDTTLRLQHLSTRLFLHSHHFSSPLSNNQEVSAYGDGMAGDHGDNWILECTDSDDFWSRDDLVRFKHKDTNKLVGVN